MTRDNPTGEGPEIRDVGDRARQLDSLHEAYRLEDIIVKGSGLSKRGVALN